MNKFPKPIFQKNLDIITWKKIYAREYGVQYSEMALLCLSPKAEYHIPSPSVNQVIIPEGNNTVFYIDETSWNNLVNSLNLGYTSNISELEKYEKQFTLDGTNYVAIAEKISRLHIPSLTNTEMSTYFKEYQEKLFTYSVFAWTSFILNIYVSDRATKIIEKYILKNKLEEKKQEIIDSLFQPVKRAAILELQYEVEKNINLSEQEFNILFEKYRWLSCLDVHNKPWTKKEFEEIIAPFKKSQLKQIKPFDELVIDLAISKDDLEYLMMAKRFVYIKDARDDFRRKGVYLVLPFFAEIAKRMDIQRRDISYVQTSEVIEFLDTGRKVSIEKIQQRKQAFVMYLDTKMNIVTIENPAIITDVLSSFHLQTDAAVSSVIKGRTACNGQVKGRVAIVYGVKDLKKVKEGSILVAVTTHPDYTSAMRKAAAIITDEGGITSHAAIVSREYNIPCIVGTHTATKILKDGDTVEVNATEGVVKRM